MSRESRRRRQENKSKDKSKTTDQWDKCDDDLEVQQIFVGYDPEDVTIIRNCYTSREWWLLLTFQSEIDAFSQPRNLFAELATRFPVDKHPNNVVTFSTPCKRKGIATGVREDTYIIVGLRKTFVPPTEIQAILDRHRIRSNIPVSGENDVIPISYAFKKALMHVLNRLLKATSHEDN